MNKFIFIFISLFLTNTQLFALSLEEAYKQASLESHEIKTLQLEVQAAGWSETKAYSQFLPKLDLVGSRLLDNRFMEIETNISGMNFISKAIQPYTLIGVTSSLSLFSGFRSINELDAARYEKEVAEQRLARAQEKKRTEIRSLFYRALGSELLVQVAEQNIHTLEEHLNEMSSRVRSGVSTRFDVLRTEVQLEDAKSEKILAENNVNNDRAKLFEALGKSDDKTPLVGALPENFEQINLSQLQIQEQNRSDRAALIAEQARNQKLAQAAKAHWLPQISLYGNYDWYNNINTTISGSDAKYKPEYAVGIKLTWNIFDGGFSYASQKQAQIRNDITNQQLAKMDLNIPATLEESKRLFTYHTHNYKAKLSSIRKAEEAVRLARGGLKAGTRTNTEVLDAVVDLNKAKASAIKSQLEAIEAIGQLELSLGYKLL